MVYMTSEGKGYDHRPAKAAKLPGVQVIDAYTKKVIASATYDLGFADHGNPHGLGVSPDGKWIYIGTADGSIFRPAPGKSRVLVINARTLKLQMVLKQEGYYQGTLRGLHHIQAFKDWEGRDRVVLNFGFGADGGPHFVLDPKDNHRVVRAITFDDMGGHKMGHPYTTPDPTGKFLYVSLVAPEWRSQLHNTGGIGKFNLETGDLTVIPYTGNHPIGITHTADGKFTYVIDGEGSYVYKIDNAKNAVVASTSAGVGGPYGIALNWDETELWTVGKGEGTHNTGGVMGVIDTRPFAALRAINQPVNIGGSIIDHAILHPDPAVNELWVSSAGTWETIVVDLGKKERKAGIPSPNGGDTHSGAFVRYNPDWNGELLADQGGPKSKSMRDAVKAKVASVAAK
jgi:hypothetical protein